MTYKALYRNYRPQIFSDIAGQEHIVTTLKNAINNDKVSHAYLFSGPRGTGKTTIAKLLAKAVNCCEETKPCGICDSCISTKEGSHSDVIEIDAASNNGVDEVRDLIDKVKYAPIIGKYKIYIIDEVHMMTQGAFNALLKTLEEPPKHAIFILATTEPHKVLSTIVSRCQRFDFKKVSANDIISRMKIILDEEGKQYQDAALIKISKLADGGMRDALSILEQCLSYDDNLSLESVEVIYGLLSMEHKINFLKKIINKDLNEVLPTLDYLLSSGKDLKILTLELIDILKDCIIYKNTNNLDLLFQLSKKDVDSIVPFITIEEVFNMIDIFIEATLQFPKSVDVKMYFEVAIIKLCNKIDNTEVSEIVLEQKNNNVQEVFEKQTEEVRNNLNDTFMTKISEIQREDSISISDLKNDDSNNIIDENDVLNILVQANKNICDEIKDKWTVIPKYKYHLNTARFASILENATPVAACNGGLIITFLHTPQVISALDENIYHDLRIFIKELLGQDYNFIALTSDHWSNIRNKFITLKQSDNLPEAKDLSFSHVKDYVAPKINHSDAKQHALDFFGEELVEFKD